MSKDKWNISIETLKTIMVPKNWTTCEMKIVVS